MAVPVAEQRKLFQRSGDMCAFPGCRRALTAQATDTGSVAVLGEMAHIVADSPKGPRGAAALTPSERNRYENLVLLCNYHHQLVDSLPATWTATRLTALKRAHEAWVRRRLGLIDPVTGEADRDGPADDFLTRFIIDADHWPTFDSSIDRAVLGIHPALPLPPESAATLSLHLPQYVPRDLDAALRAAVSDAERRSAFIVLVGPSASGKTRAAYEAVRDRLAGWRMIAPPTAADLRELVASGIPLERSVIWLDELVDHLDSGEVGLRDFRAALARGNGPVLVIGTMWPIDFDRVSGPGARARDKGSDAAAVLRLATRFDVARAFTEAELLRAAETATVDPRIREAVDHSADAAIPSSLACAPELIHRWEQPSDPYGAALVTAAVEARLCGHPAVVPHPLLRLLAAEYLTGAQRATATADWFDGALAWALQPVRGDVAPLTPEARRIGELDGYRASDILTHRAAQRALTDRRSPTKPWEVLVAHAAADACHAIALFADSCGHEDHATAAWERAAETGDAASLIGLGMARMEGGDPEGAEACFRRAVEAGDGEAMPLLAVVLEQVGRRDEAHEWIRRGAEEGVPSAMVGLGRLREDEGEAEAARHWYEAATAAGDDGMGRLYLGCMLRDQGDVEGALRCLHEAAEAGFASVESAAGLMPVGATDTALARYRASAATTYGEAALCLGQLYERLEALEQAKAWFHRAGLVGRPEGMTGLATLLRDEGDPEQAATWFRAAAETGAADAAFLLAMVLDEAGEAEEAGEWFRTAALTEHPLAMGRYAIHLFEQGDEAEAHHWAARAQEAGDPLIGTYLATSGRTEGPPAPAVLPIDPGDLSDALAWTPVAQTCGCVTDWGRDPDGADPVGFTLWCSITVEEVCPWHAAPGPVEERTPLLLTGLPGVGACYARPAGGTDVELGRRIAARVRELLAEAGGESGVLFDERMMHLILDRRP